MNKRCFVYILECANGNYYTGYTTDIERRFKEHLAGSAKCKYTRSFPPVKIAACWVANADNISLMLKAEKMLKRLSKNAKVALISNPENLSQLMNVKSEITPIYNCITPQEVK